MISDWERGMTMVNGKIRGMLIVALMAGMSIGGAWASGADPEVTVSISGSLHEMLPVLELLRNMGFGFASPEEAEQPLRLEVHSVVRDSDLLKDVVGAGAPAAAAQEQEAAAAEPVPADKLGLYQGQVEPATAAPGAGVTISVLAVDPNRAIDTMGAQIVGVENAHADLYDDGTHGDGAAKDGVWTCSVSLPAEMLTGEHHVEVTAYDAYGDPVNGENGEPLRARIPLTIAK